MAKDETKNSRGGTAHSDKESSISHKSDSNERHDADAMNGSNLNGSNNSHDHQNGKDNRRGKGGIGLGRKLNLGAWTEVTNDTVRSLSEAEKAINNLGEAYGKHISDIRELDAIQCRLSKLEEESTMKDDEISRQKIMIDGLTEYREDKNKTIQKERINFNNERIAFEEERQAFKKAKETVEKRAKMELAQQNLKDKQMKQMQNQLEKLTQHKTKRDEDNRKAISELQVNNDKISKELEDTKAELNKSRREYKDMLRLRISFEKEAKALEEKLDMMKDEFGLKRQGLDFLYEP